MISVEQVEQTEVRAADPKSTVREERTDLRFRGEAPERVVARLQRLAQAPKTVVGMADAPPPPSKPEDIGPEHELFLERIIGANNLLAVAFLELGAVVARCVGRVHIRSSPELVVGYGTGFLVSPQLLMTNNHVLKNAQLAVHSLIEFGYQAGRDGIDQTGTTFALEPNRFFVTDPKLDYTLVAVAEAGRDGVHTSDYGWTPLIETEGKIVLGERLNIVQHPDGGPKLLSIRENRLKNLLEDFLHYETDTAPGSSGAPVFNDQWDVVGLHHSGVPERDAQNRILAMNGTVWTRDMGEAQIKWKSNEGARVSRIVAHIRRQRLDAEGKVLRDELFDEAIRMPLTTARTSATPNDARAPSASVTVRGSAPARSDSPRWSPETPPDGAATWTVPLTISISVGSPSRDARQVARVSRADGSASGSEPTGASLAVGPTIDAAADGLAELERGRGRPYYAEASDEHARTKYYEDVPRRLSRRKLYWELHDLVRETHTMELAYRPSTHVYPWVDLRPDRQLRSIYSGKQFDPQELIVAEARVEEERNRIVQEWLTQEGTLSEERRLELETFLEAAAPYNCEHVVPQSWFDKREPMRGDLHHLFCCEWGCNSFRGNTPYFDFEDFEEVTRTDCGKREALRFEPSAGKGAVARATLFFLLRYPDEINAIANEYQADRIATLLTWHEQDRVDDYERHRNAAIQEKQGNRNPLIDHPEWARKIDFAAGLGT